MRALERAVRDAVSELNESRAGRWVAVATGVGVAMPVARTFLGMGGELAEGLAWALPLSALAFVCTTIGTLLALRAKSMVKAALQVLAWNLLPPTLICAPTIIGLFFSVPSGFAAFLVVLPFALSAKVALADERPGRAERARLIGGLFAGLSAAGLVVYDALDPWRYRVHHVLEPAPAIIAAAFGLAIVTRALVTDARRAWVARALGHGRLPGWALGTIENGRVTVERATLSGAGPMREAVTRDAFGEIAYSPLRLGLAVALALALTALFATAIAVTL